MRLLVAVVFGVCHVTIPQGVVGKDKGTWSHKGQEGFVGLDIGALVAIQECHIKLHSEFPCLLLGISYDKLHMVCPGRFLYPLAGEGLLLIVDFEGEDQPPSFSPEGEG